MKVTRIIAIAISIPSLLLACARAPSPSCNDKFAGNQIPILQNENLQKKTAMLCYSEFAVLHSGVSRTPLWSAEHLTAQQINGAKDIKRKNTFHPEERLPASDRSELGDYTHSGYDRGHMAPSGDMSNEKAQNESFSLANIIPQHPKNNQLLWAAIEEGTRELSERESQLYVITGPIFEGSALQRLNGRVLVPTYVYKAIYDPKRNEAGAYLARNAAGLEYQTLSIADLEKRIGINLFPALPDEVKARKMNMPPPRPYNARSRNKPVEVDSLTP